ncbi:MAG: molecular chaperone Hsp33 [Inquilinus sp.]|nr:molecular chaperone Hsp33 [Inquilinus sp.]
MTASSDPATDDIVQPFQIEASALRGRLVRLGAALDEILNQHAYPEPVATLLGEAIAVAILMASALKYEGVFTLQTRGDGPVPLLVVDVASTGDLRGYARFEADRLSAAAPPAVSSLIGTGLLAFTVDQGEFTERYQGIVDLTGETLAECLQHYFRQSEQLDAGIRLAVGRRDGRWRAGALMVQRLPEPGQPPPASDREDDWRRAMVLLGSAREDEFLDTGLAANGLLYRLYHEDGVRVFAPHALRAACRCSRERVIDTLAALPRPEVEALKEDGRIYVQCEFCNSSYSFDDAQLAAVFD